MRVWLIFASLLAMLFAGCLENSGSSEEGKITRNPNLEGAIEQLHDHTDYTLHTGRHGISSADYSALEVTLGENGFANFVLWQSDSEKLALIAIDGDNVGGFNIASIQNEIEVLGTYRAPGSGFQEVRITPDGQYAILNVQEIPSTVAEGACSICLHIVDISDRSAPALVGYLPVEILGSHNMHIEEYDIGLFMFAVSQPLDNSPVGNYVIISQLLETPAGLQAVRSNQFQHTAILDSGRSFPHDVIVQTHPITGQKLAYVSHWDGGFQVWDVSNPLLPILTPLSIVANKEPSEALQIHWIYQEETVRDDGRVIAWSAPEIGVLAGSSGIIRSYDVTDPSNVIEIGSWELPGGIEILGQYMMSPHVVTKHATLPLLAVAHYHAGIWLLDVSDPSAPTELGYYLPHGEESSPYSGEFWWKKPNFDPEGYGPNAYMVRWDGDMLWATDRGTGLYKLDPSPIIELLRA